MYKNTEHLIESFKKQRLEKDVELAKQLLEGTGYEVRRIRETTEEEKWEIDVLTKKNDGINGYAVISTSGRQWGTYHSKKLATDIMRRLNSGDLRNPKTCEA